LASRLGRLRNLDVSLERFWLPLDQALASDPQIGRATAPLLAAQATERAALRLDLLMPEVGQLICQLHILLESLDLPDQITRPLPVTETVGLLEPAVLHPSETLGEFLLDRLKRRIKKLTARSKSDPEALHRLRLAYKAMRYAAPILDDLGVKARLDTMSKKAAKAQERLGDDQDRAVALQTLEQAMQSQSVEGETADYCLAVLRGYLAAQAIAQS
jgi:CHAD domain-containing protein